MRGDGEVDEWSVDEWRNGWMRMALVGHVEGELDIEVCRKVEFKAVWVKWTGCG